MFIQRGETKVEVSPSVLIAALSTLVIIVLALLGAWHAIDVLGLGSGGGIAIGKLMGRLRT